MVKQKPGIINIYYYRNLLIASPASILSLVVYDLGDIGKSTLGSSSYRAKLSEKEISLDMFKIVHDIMLALKKKSEVVII